MNKRKIILIMMVCCLVLTGCWDHNEPERLLYLHGLGVDYKDGQVIVYSQIINLQGLAKQESGGNPSTIPQSDVGRAVGGTFEEALFNLYRTLDRRLFWGHLSYVVFSEAAVKNGQTNKIADFIDRFRETRYRTYFFMTKDSLKDILLITPVDNIALAFSKLSDPRDNYKQSSFIETVNLRELILNIDEPPHEVRLPILKITTQWANKTEKKEQELSIETIAVVKNNTLVGVLPTEISLGLRPFNKNVVRYSVPLFPELKESMSVVVYDKKTTIIPVIESDGTIRFNLKLKMKANLPLPKSKKTKKEYEKELRRVIKKGIYHTYDFTRKRDIDVFKLSNTLYRKNNKEWKRIEKEGQIPLKKDTINSIIIDVQLQNTGRNNIHPLFQ